MLHARRCIQTPVIFAATVTIPAAIPAQTAHGQRAGLVTGASSGIGRKITEKLAASGFFVYAVARSAPDLDTLNKIKNVQSIRPVRTVSQR